MAVLRRYARHDDRPVPYFNFQWIPRFPMGGFGLPASVLSVSLW